MNLLNGNSMLQILLLRKSHCTDELLFSIKLKEKKRECLLKDKYYVLHLIL